jgi:lipopolysaccharide export system permease protein
MKRLDAYLLRALVLALVFVTLAVTAAIWLTQSLRYVDVVVENGAPLPTFIWLALLTLPTFLAIILPIALFVAVLFTYHRFIQDSELVAMRACGLSPRALARPALMLAAGCVLLGYLLSLWLQPATKAELARLQYMVQSQFSAALLKEGTFNDLGNRMTIYVARREQNAELSGILIHDGRDPANPITIRAARGLLAQSASGPKVIVYDGVQQEYDRAKKRLSELTFDSYAVSLDTLVPEAQDRLAMPREMTTLALISSVLAESNNPVMQARQRAELSQRLVTPLLSLGYTLIATTCLLFGSFNRRGHAGRVALAILLAALTQALVLGLGQAVSRTAFAVIPLFLAALAPILIGGQMFLRQTETRWAR